MVCGILPGEEVYRSKKMKKIRTAPYSTTYHPHPDLIRPVTSPVCPLITDGKFSTT